MTQSKTVLLIALAGCTTDTGTSVEPVGPNALGVTRIETSRTALGDNRVFELIGLDERAAVVGSVRLETGDIAHMSATAPGDDNIGSEIVFSVAGVETRVLTRETELFELGVDDTRTQEFVSIPAIASTLAEDAHLIVAQPAALAGEEPFTTQTCPVNYMLTSPTAFQCCYGNYSGGTQTRFVKAISGGYQVVQRKRNPYGTGCKASDGLGACSGTACFYGPLGFARATFENPPTGTYWPKTVDSSGSCYHFWYNTVVPPPVFSNVNGTGSTSQGCPGGNDNGQAWIY